MHQYDIVDKPFIYPLMFHEKLHIIKKIALAASIVVVLNLFVNMGVKTFYPAPKYEAFCPQDVRKIISEQAACVEAGGQWTDRYEYYAKPTPIPMDQGPLGWCDADFTCRKGYETSNQLYERNVFIVLVIAGLIAIGAGYAITVADAVASGFVFGGVISFIVGTVRYWSAMHDYLRFAILGAALVVLIWIGYTKLRK